MQELVWDEDLASQARTNVIRLPYVHWKPENLHLNVASNFGWEFRGQNVIAEVIRLVNAKFHSIGCASRRVASRRPADVLFCLYKGNPGTSEEEFGFEYGEPCTKCVGPNNFCRENLCVACNNQDNCDCRKTCAENNVGAGVLDRSTCTCTCTYGNGPNCDQPCRNIQIYNTLDICQLVVDEQDCQAPEMIEDFKKFCPLSCGFCRPAPQSGNTTSS
ncbi:uncharacterized protein LOC131952493 [Physella acuta]|uniref:uncharacterized protein LOC131952493 n=1 Tax=Physella acuta TaxID=109671 RepID=UPI0027DDCFFE|nr:uncharacterized protein LOC131952493 [Physella acuta]